MQQDLSINKDWLKQALLSSLHLLSDGHAYYGASRVDIELIFICTLPVFLAVMLFNYLHLPRAATMLHSLPSDRKTLLGSHVAAGISLISAPVLITAILLSMLSLFTGLGEYYSVVNVLEWTCLTLLYHIFFFSIAVFVGMFTGNAVAHFVFTYIVNLLPYGLYMLVAYGIETLLRGFSAEGMEAGWAQILPLMSLVGFSFNEFTVVQGLLYLLAAFVFLLAAGFAYNGRRLEAAGDIVAFRTVRPVFKYGVAVCLMLSAGFFAGHIKHGKRSDVIVLYFIFAFIGYWIAQMLLDKTVKVWHAYKGFLLFNAVIILLIAGISADVTGYVKHIPDVNEIESAYFGSNYTSWLSRKDKQPELAYFHTEGLFTEKANIKAVTELHRVLADSSYEDGGREEYIAYTLKNGKSILRKYAVDEYAVRTLIGPLYESHEYKVDKYPVLQQKAEDIKLIEIQDRRTAKKPLILSNEKLVQSFTDALKQELTDADYGEITESEGGYVDIQITDTNNFTAYYSLGRNFETIYKWLRDNGNYDSVLLLPEEIAHVTVQTIKVTQRKNSVNYTPDSGSSMDFTDKALIKELLDICSYGLVTGNSGTYLELRFYSQTGTPEPSFIGFLSLDAPMSEALRQSVK